jgi:hypothetical protein
MDLTEIAKLATGFGVPSQVIERLHKIYQDNSLSEEERMLEILMLWPRDVPIACSRDHYDLTGDDSDEAFMLYEAMVRCSIRNKNATGVATFMDKLRRCGEYDMYALSLLLYAFERDDLPCLKAVTERIPQDSNVWDSMSIHVPCSTSNECFVYAISAFPERKKPMLLFIACADKRGVENVKLALDSNHIFHTLRKAAGQCCKHANVESLRLILEKRKSVEYEGYITYVDFKYWLVRCINSGYPMQETLSVLLDESLHRNDDDKKEVNRALRASLEYASRLNCSAWLCIFSCLTMQSKEEKRDDVRIALSDALKRNLDEDKPFLSILWAMFDALKE